MPNAVMLGVGRLYVKVDDIKAATREGLKSLGATVIKDQIEVKGVGSFSIITDPTGAMLGLLAAEERLTATKTSTKKQRGEWTWLHSQIRSASSSADSLSQWSPQYRRARNALLEQEMELRRQVERVAAQRRALLLGGAIRRTMSSRRRARPAGRKRVRLSELLHLARKRLPSTASCSDRSGSGRVRAARIPRWSGRCRAAHRPAHQLRRRRQVAAAAHPFLRQGARLRGCNSCPRPATPTTATLRRLDRPRACRTQQQEFKDGEEWDMPILNVFRRAVGIRHFWGCELLYVPPEPGQEHRHNDLLDPVWNMSTSRPRGGRLPTQARLHVEVRHMMPEAAKGQAMARTRFACGTTRTPRLLPASTPDLSRQRGGCRPPCTQRLPSGKKGDVLTVEFTVAGVPCLGLNGGPRSSTTKPSRSRSPPTISRRPTATGTPSSAMAARRARAAGARTSGASPGKSRRAC